MSRHARAAALAAIGIAGAVGAVGGDTSDDASISQIRDRSNNANALTVDAPETTDAEHHENADVTIVFMDQ